jgi:ribosomal protein L40E
MNSLASRPSWLLIMIVAVLVIAIVSAARRRKWMQRNFDVKVCAHCGASQPPHAGYCRQCGNKV